jgi:hemolysin-activating ACP:hemolysin acyltransferase
MYSIEQIYHILNICTKNSLCLETKIGLFGHYLARVDCDSTGESVVAFVNAVYLVEDGVYFDELLRPVLSICETQQLRKSGVPNSEELRFEVPNSDGLLPLQFRENHLELATSSRPWLSRPDILEKCEENLARYAQFGQALLALSRSPVYKAMPLRSAMTMLATAIGTRQMRLYFDNAGEPTGLLTWAWLSQWTIDRLAWNDSTPMHICEWNEGSVLCFRDIAASRESVQNIAADLSGGFFPEETSCAVLVRDRVSEGAVLFQVAEGERESLRTWLSSQFKPIGVEFVTTLGEGGSCEHLV